MFINNNCEQFISRKTIIGHETANKISNFGIAQFKNSYDQDLLDRILEKAVKIRQEGTNKDLNIKKHLNLTFLTSAQKHIPEIKELIDYKGRLDFLSDLCGTELEPYPLVNIAATITFMGSMDHDGTIDWHSDGVPMTELIPLEISNEIIGGELEIYMGNSDVGLHHLEVDKKISPEKCYKVRHQHGYSILGHLMGVLHRTVPIKYGQRVTCNLNLRSVKKPFIDNNNLTYLYADYNDPDLFENIRKDVINNQLPAYIKYQQGLKCDS